MMADVRLGSAAAVIAAAALLSGCSAAPAEHAPSHSAQPEPAVSPAVTVSADGSCNTTEASWAPMTTGSGIAVLTYVTGHLRVDVATKAGPVSRSVTVGFAQTPYSIELPTAAAASVRKVTLTSTDAPTSTCTVAREPGA